MSRHATAASAFCVAALLASGCNATARHKALTIFFDGVPPRKEAPAPAAAPAAPETGAPTRPLSHLEHGPYAAKLCGACHDAAATNALVVPKDQLCFQCHELEQDVTYVHGPLASGGCLVCHNPHGSEYGFLLVSESDSFCLRCHDREAIVKIPGHGDAQANCTNCHDAHGSNTKYFLK